MQLPHHHALLGIGLDFDYLAASYSSDLDCFEITRRAFAILAIGDVRQIIAEAYLKPFEHEVKLVVIEAERVAPEAQHALLKVLEEPPITTRFILLLPNESSLLPTLRSRLQNLVDNDLEESSTADSFRNFMTVSATERIAQIAKVTKDKNETILLEWKNGLERWLKSCQTSPETVSLQSRLLWCLVELSNRGAAKKMLWEEIALSLPVAGVSKK